MGVYLIPWTPMNYAISGLAGVRAAVKAKAMQIADDAEGRLSAHHYPVDTTEATISVTSGKVDSFVNLDDTGGGAMGIEFGHRTQDGHQVRGLHIITGAAGI
jgi:hypothetical protein